ncbi:type II toxin-antitoxin system death-on-curing family toxin [Streptococcus sp. sy004]|uniref:type II toxin-antitoxin system death-on-curing family toxin n=1 Tax=Streptococcus sp. sy004 TaxID=2600149 RepID=UPI0011B6E7E0|nr:type II toxin-antitoxin system death-on-curing family toxin [Streptococcus sp. sy004]TWT12067.1 type II toxin-antitoxin system death-on-curing family toxin [Streptococcus sp. sy004]
MTIYLSEEDLIFLNQALITRYSPNEPVGVLDKASLNMIVNLPQLDVFGQEMYENLFDKAMIFFVQLVKKHCFVNANKRTAVYALIKFLRLNGYHLVAEVKELVDFSVDVAMEPLSDENMKKWSKWIEKKSERLE